MGLELSMELEVGHQGDRAVLYNTTGAYDPVGNPNGFGVINPTVAESALMIYGVSVNSKGNLIGVMPVLSGSRIIYSAQLADDYQHSWELGINTDGYHKLYMIRFPLSDTGLVTGEYYYDSITGKIMKKTADSAEELLEENYRELIDPENNQRPLQVLYEEMFYTYNILHIKDLYQVMKEYRDNRNSKKASKYLMRIIENYIDINVGADLAFFGGSQLEAQDIVENLNSRQSEPVS